MNPADDTSDAFEAGRRALDEGRHAIALEHFTAVIESGVDDRRRLAALAYAANVNLTLKRPHEALVWVDMLRDEAPSQDQADLLEAAARLQLGEPDEALRLLDGVRDPGAEFAIYDRHLVEMMRMEGLVASGDPDQAVAVAVTAAAQPDQSPALWSAIAGLATDLSLDVGPIADAVDAEALEIVGAGLSDGPPLGCERVVDALWQRHPGSRPLLAVMVTVGHRLTLPRALEWSGRLRAEGLGNHCPLLGLAASDDREPAERVHAAAVAGATFADERARGLLELATTAVADDDVPSVLADLIHLAPDYADSFVVAAAQTPRRSLLVALALEGTGNTEPALAVAHHARELTTGQPDAWRAAVSSTLVDVEDLAGPAERAGDKGLAQALRDAVA